MNDDQLINKKFHILQRNKISNDPEKFIYNEISSRINDSLNGLNLSIRNCLEIGWTADTTYKYLINRNKNINYNVLDISRKILESVPKKVNKICIDHDEWNLEKKQFNLIISNFYMHLTNNLEIFFNNVNNSLSKNGFFIASVPSDKFLKELKQAMLLTDLKIYSGAYKRFNNSFSVNNISSFLKKSNFKDTIIEIDVIKIQYTNFPKLLKDIKNLGNSYMLLDKKKYFENKNYFKYLEENYWDKFSKNNKINLTLEIIYFSGWKI